jgi:hypothetical protein
LSLILFLPHLLFFILLLVSLPTSPSMSSYLSSVPPSSSMSSSRSFFFFLPLFNFLCRLLSLPPLPSFRLFLPPFLLSLFLPLVFLPLSPSLSSFLLCHIFPFLLSLPPSTSILSYSLPVSFFFSFTLLSCPPSPFFFFLSSLPYSPSSFPLLLSPMSISLSFSLSFSLSSSPSLYSLLPFSVFPHLLISHVLVALFLLPFVRPGPASYTIYLLSF